MYEEIIKKEYGNIYSYTSKRYHDSNYDINYAVAGNAPFLIERKTGKIVLFGTALPFDDYVKMYEEGELEDTLDDTSID